MGKRRAAVRWTVGMLSVLVLAVAVAEEPRSDRTADSDPSGSPGWRPGAATTDSDAGSFVDGTIFDRASEPDRPPSGRILARGRVEMPDGTSPGEPVDVRLECEGSTVGVVRTDARGRFLWAIGDLDPSRFDASLSSDVVHGLEGLSQGYIGRGGCEFGARVVGFRSDPFILLPSHVRSGDLRVRITLRADSSSPGHGISPTSRGVARADRREFDRAARAFRAGKPERAAQRLEQLLRRTPRHAAARTLLGWTRLRQGRTGEALSAFRRASEADPGYVWPYAGLALEAAGRRDWTALEAWSSRLTALAGEQLPVAHYLRGVARFALGDLDGAERSARRAEALGWTRVEPRTEVLLSEIRARRIAEP